MALFKILNIRTTFTGKKLTILTHERPVLFKYPVVITEINTGRGSKVVEEGVTNKKENRVVTLDFD